MGHLSANLSALAAVLGPGVSIPQDDGRLRLDTTRIPPVLYRSSATSGAAVALNSRRDPLAEARTLVDSALGDQVAPPVVVAIGLGLGFVIDAIEARCPAARILALEPEPACVRFLLERRDLAPLLRSGRLLLLWGPDYVGASHGWQLLGDAAVAPPTVLHPALSREDPSAFRAAVKVVEQMVFGARANASARRELAGRYLLNTVRNLGTICRSGDVGQLSGRFEGVPGIVISAGPSLDRNIEELREVTDRAVFVAVDTALRPLLAAGIHPHLAVAVDPSEANGRHLCGLPEAPRTHFVAEGSIAPSAFEEFEGKVFTFRVGDHAPWPWLRAQGLDRSLLQAWGSVATCAFDLCLRAGCNPIIFVGQDLAYTDGRPYCRGTAYEEKWVDAVRRGRGLPQVWADAAARVNATTSARDVHGGAVQTTSALLAFRDWFLEQFARHPERNFINATGAGILTGPYLAQGRLGDVLRKSRRIPELQHTLEEARVVDGRIEDRLRVAVQALVGAIRAGQRPDPAPAWYDLALRAATPEEVCAALTEALADSPRRGAADRSAAPDWLVSSVRRIIAPPPSSRGEVAFARLPSTAAPLERAAAIRARLFNESGALVQGMAGTSPSVPADAIGVALSAWLALATVSPVATGKALGLGPAQAHVAADRLPATALFTWSAPARECVDALESAWSVSLESKAPPRPARTAFYDRPIAAYDRDQTGQSNGCAGGDEEPLSIDQAARLTLAAQWVSLLRFLEPVLDGPAGPGFPSSLLPHLWAGRRSESLARLAVRIERGAGAEEVSTGLAVPLWSMMRELTGHLVVIDDGEPANERAEVELCRHACRLSDGERATVRLLAACDPASEAPRDPRTAFLGVRRGLRLAPIVLSDTGLPAAQPCATLNADSAVVTPAHSTRSFVITEDGGVRAEADTPLQMLGEAPFGCGGDRLVWGHRPAPFVALRAPDGRVRCVDDVPFLPFRPAQGGDGLVYWSTDSGLWCWTPGSGGRKLAELPPCFGIRIVQEGCRLEPRLLGDRGHPLRNREGNGWVWRAATGEIAPVALGPLGPCWSRAERPGWTAETFPYSDLVRITAPDGKVFWLACYYPVNAAWAASTLIVTSRLGDVLAFPYLASRWPLAGSGY